MTSPDGINWTDVTTTTTPTLDAVCYGNGLFIAIGEGDIFTSPNGITWTIQKPASITTFNSICFGNNLFIVVGESGLAMTSLDGISRTTS
jgi:hypothetical protein